MDDLAKKIQAVADLMDKHKHRKILTDLFERVRVLEESSPTMNEHTIKHLLAKAELGKIKTV
jgi:predicted transcriptional regulator